MLGINEDLNAYFLFEWIRYFANRQTDRQTTNHQLGYTVTKVCTSPRNSTSFTRPFLLVRGWGLGTRLTTYTLLCACMWVASYPVHIGSLAICPGNEASRHHKNIYSWKNPYEIIVAKCFKWVKIGIKTSLQSLSRHPTFLVGLIVLLTQSIFWIDCLGLNNSLFIK